MTAKSTSLRCVSSYRFSSLHPKDREGVHPTICWPSRIVSCDQLVLYLSAWQCVGLLFDRSFLFFHSGLSLFPGPACKTTRTVLAAIKQCCMDRPICLPDIASVPFWTGASSFFNSGHSLFPGPACKTTRTLFIIYIYPKNNCAPDICEFMWDNHLSSISCTVN